MEFRVFQKQQDHLADTAPHGATRTLVELILFAGLAQKIGQNAIKLTIEAPWREVKICARGAIKAHAHALRVRCAPKPDKTPRAAGTLPPREVPGVFFQPPQSLQWKIAHRSVTFMREQTA